MIQKATALNASVAADAKQPLCKNNKESIADLLRRAIGDREYSLSKVKRERGTLP